MSRFWYPLPLVFIFMLGVGEVQAQESPLTIDQIMQEPESWIGDWPTGLRWDDRGEYLYFNWNPRGAFESDSLFRVHRTGGEPEQVPPELRREPTAFFTGWHHGEHVYDAAFNRKVFAQDGDVYLHDRVQDQTIPLTSTRETDSNPRFSVDGDHVLFTRNDNVYSISLQTGATTQLTDLRSGSASEEEEYDEQEQFLRDQQRELFEYIRQQQDEREQRELQEERDRQAADLPPTFYFGDGAHTQLRIDPNERFVSFSVYEAPREQRPTHFMDFVTESGYAEPRTARAKVGSPQSTATFFIQDLARDTTYEVDLHQVPGAYDVPPFLAEQGVEQDTTEHERDLFAFGPYWSGDGQHAVLEVRAGDNKDRWITRLNAETGDLTVLDRQHDPAWIAGPGISRYGRGTAGWLTDNRHFYFQSEETGYSHLYLVDVLTGETSQLTDGEFEVFDPQLSQDGQEWLFLSSEESPFVRHVYRMPAHGGERTRISFMDGMTTLAIAPTEDVMGLNYSFIDQPPEVFLHLVAETASAAREAEPERITFSPTEEWHEYDWRIGEIIHIPASDEQVVPAQLFVPENPNGAAVHFVHGAGYLQNVHHGWSSYFREYMFHNLLADLGYTVVNVDFRASAGYGRDWRTAIYRHMGGRDLQDYVDASRYLQAEYGIDSQRQFIYGGSYGGFITLMALFNEPEHFGGGAALRSVTDWAHYNHGYTSNILNTPQQDSLAFARSSPIYFAEGLEDPLLIAHGMVDGNVQFQDVVRLAQRLIELRKSDWEMAVYPVEPHGFREPESWADEYERILNYIRISVGPEEEARMQVPFLQDQQPAMDGSR